MTGEKHGRRVRLATVAAGFVVLTGALLVWAAPAVAQDISVNFGQGGAGLTERVIQLIA